MECFASQVARYGDRPAVKSENESITYAELDRFANRIAHALLGRLPDGDDTLVVVLVEPGPVHVAAVIGSLKAGCAYLPLDPDQPTVRQAAILSDSGARVLLCDAAHAGRAKMLAGNAIAVIETTRLHGCYPEHDPCVSVSPAAAGYVLYTSGSTGTPKGVQLSHRAVAHSALEQIGSLGLNPTDRIAAFLSAAHGLSASLMFQALLSGAVLLPFDLRRNGLRSLATWLRRECVSLIKATPSVIRHMIDALAPGESLPHLRYVWFGGEPLFREDVERVWPRVAPDCRVISGLSSTETKNVCRQVISRESAIGDGPISVGYPVAGKRLRLVDEAGQEAAPGAIGELWVQSRYLADGYWRDPDLTHARFWPAPDAADERIYRTGDFARQRDDGTIELCGRRDLQVKVRGFRVQVEEVEAALRRLAGVKDAAVGVETAGRDRRLVGCVVPDGTGGDAQAIRGRLAEIVPEYMVPSRLVLVDALPLSPSGKVNRGALGGLFLGEDAPAFDYEAPRTRTETIVLKTARRVVSDSSFGRGDDFFRAGGDSLAAAALLAGVEQIFQVRISIGEFYEKPTVAWLAARVEALRADPAAQQIKDDMLVSLGGRTIGPPIFLVPGGGGSEIELFLTFSNLVEHLGEAHPVIGLRPVTPDGRLAAGADVDTMADRFSDEIRAHQEYGPYALVGWCGGGMLAVEVARRLKASGQQVRLVMFDTYPPQQSEHLQWRLRRRIRVTLRGFARVPARIRHHLREGARMPVQARKAYFLEKMRKARMIITGAGPPPDYRPEGDVAERIMVVRERYRSMLLGFCPRPYPGSITLLASSSRDHRQMTDGWRSYAAGGLDIVAAPGSHDSSIRTHARETARVILDSLSAVEDRFGNGALPFSAGGRLHRRLPALRSLGE